MALSQGEEVTFTGKIHNFISMFFSFLKKSKRERPRQDLNLESPDS